MLINTSIPNLCIWCSITSSTAGPNRKSPTSFPFFLAEQQNLLSLLTNPASPCFFMMYSKMTGKWLQTIYIYIDFPVGFLSNLTRTCPLCVSRCQSAVSTHNSRNLLVCFIYGTHIWLGICTQPQDICGSRNFNLPARIKTS